MKEPDTAEFLALYTEFSSQMLEILSKLREKYLGKDNSIAALQAFTAAALDVGASVAYKLGADPTMFALVCEARFVQVEAVAARNDVGTSEEDAMIATIDKATTTPTGGEWN